MSATVTLAPCTTSQYHPTQCVLQHSWLTYWSAPALRLGDEDVSAPTMKRRKTEGTAAYQPFDTAPIEIVERVLSFLPLRDRLRLKRLSKSFHTILSSPHMYPSIHLSSFPPPPPTLLALIPTLLPGAFSLKLRSFSYLTLRPLLSHIEPSRLTSLDLSFSGVADGDLLDLSDRGALDCVKVLRLKGCSAVRDGEWLARDTTLPRVEVVDLSWSGVESLPGTRIDHHLQQEVYHHPDDSGFFDLDDETETKPTVYWPSLRHLSLSSLPYLPTMSLVSFFTTVLPTLSHLSTLDLSHLGIAAKDVRTLAAALKDCKALKMLDVGGNDCLTLESVECLKRARCGSGKRQDDRAESDGDDEETRRELNVIHSALLESEDEVHVRKFVMMVAGVVSRAS